MENQQQSNSTPSQSQTGFLKQMEEFFYTYIHQKAPFHIPANAKEWIVKYGPWVMLAVMVLTIPLILVALGLSAFVAPLAMMYGRTKAGVGFIIGQVISLATLVMEAFALPGLFARSLKSWYLVYYACLISAIGGIIMGNIFGTIIGTVISLYFLFEIKEYYK